MSGASPAPCPQRRLPALLAGVHPDWLPFFEAHGLAAAAAAALSKAGDPAGSLSPAEGLIFEPFRYFGPDDALVLIVGQEPEQKDAQGLCYSAPPGLPVGESLDAIFGNLEAQGLARHHPRVQGDAASGLERCGDLRAWASQGVLLVNAAMTARVGAPGAHRAPWKDFMTRFVAAITAHTAALGRPLICMLWGGDAQAFAPAAQGAAVYRWALPATRTPLRFEDAPHFKDANSALRAAGLRPIEWDPLGFTYAFTDGSCPRNGKPDAEASYAAFIITGPLKGVEVCGRVSPREYALIDPSDPARGFAPVAGTSATPTNNRAEYLAWCWVLLLLLRGRVRGRVEVVSDCNLFIQTMEDWLPARRRKGKEKGLKNFDIVVIGEALLLALRAESGGVVLTHINSHQKRPPAAAGPRAQVLWYGNDKVDRMAGELLKSGGPEFVLGAAPALAWRLHGRY